MVVFVVEGLGIFCLVQSSSFKASEFLRPSCVGHIESRGEQLRVTGFVSNSVLKSVFLFSFLSVPTQAVQLQVIVPLCAHWMVLRLIHLTNKCAVLVIFFLGS